MKFLFAIALVIAGNTVLPFNHLPAITGNNFRTGDTSINESPDKDLSFFSAIAASKSKVAMKGIAGFSAQGRPVEAYYFPGTSDKKALVIGGMHGSELSAVAVAHALVEQLSNQDSIYYSVIVIPCLFPDNAATASYIPGHIGSVYNIGRYSGSATADPNRQMPSPGKAFDAGNPVDHLGRRIEPENQLLLRVIDQFKPQRIANLHAIRDTSRAGIYADPRTDSRGYAFEYASDSSLAIDMASYIAGNGGYAPGNKLHKQPTALYYCDPAVAAPGQWQKRNLHGSKLNGKKGEGVSLGTWASTAVEDDGSIRDAMRLLTIEFPGCKRPQDYASSRQQDNCANNIALYAGAIRNVFLAGLHVENAGAGYLRVVKK
jgi:hypothetical protein